MQTSASKAAKGTDMQPLCCAVQWQRLRSTAAQPGSNPLESANIMGNHQGIRNKRAGLIYTSDAALSKDPFSIEHRLWNCSSWRAFLKSPTSRAVS